MRFFPRGPGPLVSVLCPTRGRPEHLVASVDSLCSLAKDVGNLEFLFKVDDDDPGTLGVVQQIYNKLPCHVGYFYTPRDNGYHDIHLWLNALAQRALGDWLFVWSDDALMQTQGWDEIFLQCTVPLCWHFCPEDVCMLIPQTNGSEVTSEFFLLRRKTYEILGHVCQSCYGDAWIYEVMHFLRSAVRVSEIKISHPRTMKEYGTRDLPETYWSGPGSLVSVPALTARHADIARLLGYIAAKDARTPWRTGFESDAPLPERSWYHWKAGPDTQPMHVCRKDDLCVLFINDRMEKYEASKMGGLWRPRGEQ